MLFNSPLLENLYPFQDRVRDLAFPGMYWLDPSGRSNDYFPELKARVIVLNTKATARLLEGSGKPVEQIYTAAEQGRAGAFSLPLTAKMKIISTLKDLHSVNVVARVAGSDPVLKADDVVYSAHSGPSRNRMSQSTAIVFTTALLTTHLGPRVYWRSQGYSVTSTRLRVARYCLFH
jgi:hypothetical protein